MRLALLLLPLSATPPIGVLTALVAWYASAALVINGMKAKPVVPVGGPLIKLGG